MTRMNLGITNSMVEEGSNVRGQEVEGAADSHQGAVMLTEVGDIQAGEGIAVTEEGEGEEIRQMNSCHTQRSKQ